MAYRQKSTVSPPRQMQPQDYICPVLLSFVAMMWSAISRRRPTLPPVIP